jgi:hypothetical protein
LLVYCHSRKCNLLGLSLVIPGAGRQNDTEGIEMSGAPLFLFLAVAMVAVFSFVSVAVWADNRRKEREAYYRSETVKKIAESQAGGGGSAIEYLREEERIAMRRRREGVRLGGLITAAVGAGLMVFLHGMDSNEPAYLMGLIPFLVGVALLGYTYIMAPKDK